LFYERILHRQSVPQSFYVSFLNFFSQPPIDSYCEPHLDQVGTGYLPLIFSDLLSPLHKLLIDQSDELVGESPDCQLLNLVAVAGPLSNIFFVFAPFHSDKVPLAQGEEVEALFVQKVFFALFLISGRPQFVNVSLGLQLNFFFNGVGLRLFHVLHHKVNVHIGLLTDAPLSLELLDLQVHFANLTLYVDRLLNTLVDDCLELAVHGAERSHVLLHLFAVLTQVRLLGEYSHQVKRASV